MVLVYFNSLAKIVKDSFKAVSVTSLSAVNSPVVVGGMAIQLHCYNQPDLLRSTSDLDVQYLPRISSFLDFENGVGGLIQKHIRESGYQSQLKKSRSNYEIKIMDGQGNKAKQLFFIHFDCRNDDLHERTKHIQGREITNAHQFDVPAVGRIYVVRIEDIIPHKIKRIRKQLSEGTMANPLFGTLYKYATRMQWKNLAPLATKEWCEDIAEMQNHFPSTQKSHGSIYDMNKNLYDVCLLALKIESDSECFNKAYYLNSVSEIDSI